MLTRHPSGVFFGTNLVRFAMQDSGLNLPLFVEK
jgi:hypothetical protein